MIWGVMTRAIRDPRPRFRKSRVRLRHGHDTTGASVVRFPMGVEEAPGIALPSALGLNPWGIRLLPSTCAGERAAALPRIDSAPEATLREGVRSRHQASSPRYRWRLGRAARAAGEGAGIRYRARAGAVSASNRSRGVACSPASAPARHKAVANLAARAGCVAMLQGAGAPRE